MIRRYEVIDEEWERLKNVFSGATSWNTGAATERFPADTEWNLLDRTERGSMVRSAGAVRSMADGVQAVRGVAEKRADRENLP